MDFNQLITQFEQQRGRSLTDKEREACRQLWETMKPQMQQQENP